VRLIILFTFAGAFALWLQVGILHWLPLGGFVPDLAVILVVDLGLRQHDALAPFLAFAMGYAVDALSGSQLGLNAFTLTLVYLLVYEISRHTWMTGGMVGPLMAGGGTLIHSFGVLALGGGLASVLPLKTGLLHEILLQAIISALLAPAVFGLLRNCRRLLRLPMHTAQE
jgi:rod shape-determining protein MreD